MNCSTIAPFVLLAVFLGSPATPLLGQTVAPLPVEAAKRLEPRLFDFAGGAPSEFLSAIDKTFGVEWSQIAAIPEKARALRIPPMRMRVSTAQEVLNVANKLTGETPNLGSWITIPGQGTVSAVQYAFGRSSPPSPAMEVRAISLKDVPREKWDELLRLLDESLAEVVPATHNNQPRDSSPVTIRIHSGTALLMITATNEYIDRVEKLAVALRTGMAETPGTGAATRTFAASKLVSLAGDAMGNATVLQQILEKATAAWMSAQKDQGANAARDVQITLLRDLGGILLVGPREWIEFATPIANDWVANIAAAGSAPAGGLKARAFSVAGLSHENVARLIQEVDAHSDKLRSMQHVLADRSGRGSTESAWIQGSPQPVEELQVVIVTGNDAGLEFARSFIEETRVGMEKVAGVIKFVTVGGGVRAPQRIVWTADLTVLGAISAAGGFNDANRDTIRLIRGGETLILSRKQMVREPKKDEKLRPADRLEVEE